MDTSRKISYTNIIREHTRIKGTKKPSLLDLDFTHTSIVIENIIYDISTGRSDFVMLKFDCVINEDIRRAEVRQDIKKKYNLINY